MLDIKARRGWARSRFVRFNMELHRIYIWSDGTLRFLWRLPYGLQKMVKGGCSLILHRAVACHTGLRDGHEQSWGLHVEETLAFWSLGGQLRVLRPMMIRKIGGATGETSRAKNRRTLLMVNPVM